MNQKCKTKSSLSSTTAHQVVFSLDIATRYGTTVWPSWFQSDRKAKGSLAVFFGKYFRSKHGLVSRRQEGFVDEIVCLPAIYHN